jgi:hypothetical protein
MKVKEKKMPSAVTVLCQIKSKGLDGGFVNGLANYMISPNIFKNFHYKSFNSFNKNFLILNIFQSNAEGDFNI